MPKETVKDTAGVAVSNESSSVNPNPSTALAVSPSGDVTGPMRLALSQAMQDQLALEFQEAMHQVESGFGSLTAPGDIAAMKTPFKVIDAITIDDFEDRKTGEIKVKHVFKLEMADSRVFFTMQSDARPRRALADFFRKGRAVGARVEVGPYLYEKKDVGQIQAAWILVQQPGFQVLVS